MRNYLHCPIFPGVLMKATPHIPPIIDVAIVHVTFIYLYLLHFIAISIILIDN